MLDRPQDVTPKGWDGAFDIHFLHSLSEHPLPPNYGANRSNRSPLVRDAHRVCLVDIAVGRVPLRPDILWQIRGEPVAVIDAKYKAEKPSGYPNADLYQLLAYCTVLGPPVGHLVYAAGNEVPARHVVRQSRVGIICHALNLSQHPDLLLTEIRALTQRIAVSARTQLPHVKYPRWVTLVRK